MSWGRAEINCLKNLKLVLHFLLKLMISLARLHFTRWYSQVEASWSKTAATLLSTDQSYDSMTRDHHINASFTPHSDSYWQLNWLSAVEVSECCVRAMLKCGYFYQTATRCTLTTGGYFTILNSYPHCRKKFDDVLVTISKHYFP